MRILGIESSCDETAAAVVEDGRRVLSNVIASQVETHKLYGGVVPEIASRMHAECISQVTQEALDEAGCKMEQIDGIAVTYAPGLIGALLVGVNFAKGLALSYEKPLIPVHHLRGHIAANYLTHADLKPPFLCLVVSGGHSHIVKVNDYTEFEIIGKTWDDAAGEALDKAARSMGLPYPGGLHLDRLSQTGDDTAYKMPHPRVDGAPYDFSFSGLKTAVINLLHNAEQKGETILKQDLAASYQKAVVSCLTERTALAMQDGNLRTLVLAGGVSANSRLRTDMQALCRRHGWNLYLPDLQYCGDNAAMIAAQGFYEAGQGHLAGFDLNAVASLPIC